MNDYENKIILTDEELALLTQKGNYEAYGILIDRYEQKIKNYLFRFLQNKADIEDLSQDIFLKSFENIKSFDSKRRFSPWLYRIAHNQVVNFLKKRKYLNTTFLSLDLDTILPYQIINNDLIHEVNNNFQLENIDKVLNKLDFKYRQVFVLYYYENLSYQDISDILQIPLVTVGIRLKRARDFIKQNLNNQIK